MRASLILLLLSSVSSIDVGILGDIEKWDIRELETKIEEVLKNLHFPEVLPHFDFSRVNLTKECTEDLMLLVTGAGDLFTVPFGQSMNMSNLEKQYILPILDSSAKIGPGIMRGHIRQMGMYSECKAINYKSPEVGRHIRGEYFRVFVDNNARPYNQTAACKSLMISWDVCLPASCSSSELVELFRTVQPGHRLSPVCQLYAINERVPKPVTGTYVVGGIFVLIVGICLVCSVCDYFLKPQSGFQSNHKAFEFYWKLLQSFSLLRNVGSVFHVNENSKEGQIGTLNFMRFWCMCWVICGHIMVFAPMIVINPLDMIDFTKTWTAQLFVNGFFSVDTFFFLSGLLLSFVWFKSFNKKPQSVLSKESWIMFYLHRILRIIPAYYMTILFYTFVYSTLLKDMPPLILPEFEADSCRENWWIDLLFLNNYIRQKNMCYIVSWYLATDMQIFLFTPLVLLPFAYFGASIGYSVCFFVISLSTGLSVFQVYQMNLPPSSFRYGASKMGDPDDFQFWQYYQPYIRCQVYVIGVVVGYFLQSKKTLSVPKTFVLMLYSLSFVLMALCVFGLHGWINGTPVTIFQSAMYNAFSKPAWAFGLSWIVIAAYYGQGGALGNWMSWRIWVPLGRLSYSAYLIHIPVVLYTWGMDQSERVFTGLPDFIVSFVIPGIFYSYCAAIFWSVCFELPFAKVECLLLGAGQKNHQMVVHVEHNGHTKPIPTKLSKAKYDSLMDVAVTKSSQNWTPL